MGQRVRQYLLVERLGDSDIALLLEHLSHVEVASRRPCVMHTKLLGGVVDLCQHNTIIRAHSDLTFNTSVCQYYTDRNRLPEITDAVLSADISKQPVSMA